MEEKKFKPFIEDFFLSRMPALAQGEFAARIFAQHCDLYDAFSADGEKLLLSFPGKLKNETTDQLLKPFVGDWVIAEKNGNINRIKKILPRKSLIKKLSKKGEQVLAVNCCLILVVNSADKNFSISRLKKYATLAEKAGLPYEILLTKKDLCADTLKLQAQVQELFAKKPFFLNCLSSEGLEELSSILKPKETSLLIGPSGSGKSTLINKLCGSEIMKTFSVRGKDFKGRHTTTIRRIIPLPSGHMITDIPGIKLIEEQLPLSLSYFKIIEEKSLNCRFSNCAHDSEPDCAVKKAVESGEISKELYSKWLKRKKGLK
ncbi:MAG: ribosome small subunit-dependent GTPase A [Elusimicrobiota bacterium]